MNPIKQRLRELRKQEGLTMQQFAKRIQVSSGNVGDWESETRSSVPGANTLAVIAESFDISLDWLVLGKGESKAASDSKAWEEGPKNAGPSTIEEFLKTTKNEDYRLLMEAAITLSRTDLRMLHALALRLNQDERGIEMDQLDRAN